MAEALLRTRMAEAGADGPEVRSVGTAAVGGPATPAAVEVLADRGIDLSGHVSRPDRGVARFGGPGGGYDPAPRGGDRLGGP